MPLPLFSLAGTAIALIAGKLIKHQIEKRSASIPVSTYVYRNKMSFDDKNKFMFVAALIGLAANSDGVISEEEEKQIDSIMEAVKEKWDMEEEYEKKISDMMKSNLSIVQLREIYSSLRNVTDEDKATFRDFIHQIVASDSRVTDTEKAFQFKCELIFEEMPDIKVIRITDTQMLEQSANIIEYIYRDELLEKYPETDLRSINLEYFYTTHPGNPKEIVPFNTFFDEKFAISKDTELINAARLAGAKTVTVYAYSKDMDAGSFSAKMGAEANVAEGPSVSSDVAAAAKKLFDAEGKTAMQYTFEGKRPNIFQDWKGRNAATILKKSIWLQNDPDLTEFVNSCFGQNRVMEFSKDFEYYEIGNAMVSASIASKCKLTSVGGKVSAEFVAKSEKIRKRIVKYTVKFE